MRRRHRGGGKRRRWCAAPPHLCQRKHAVLGRPGAVEVRHKSPLRQVAFELHGGRCRLHSRLCLPKQFRCGLGEPVRAVVIVPAAQGQRRRGARHICGVSCCAGGRLHGRLGFASDCKHQRIDPTPHSTSVSNPRTSKLRQCAELSGAAPNTALRSKTHLTEPHAQEGGQEAGGPRARGRGGGLCARRRLGAARRGEEAARAGPLASLHMLAAMHVYASAGMGMPGHRSGLARPLHA